MDVNPITPIAFRFVHRPPFKADLACVETAYSLFSEKAPLDGSAEIAEVLEATKVIDLKVALLYMVWLLVLFGLFSLFYNVLNKATSKLQTLWQISRVYLNQFEFTIDLDNPYAKLLILSHIFAYYGIWVYFGAMYSTDLISSPQQEKIRALEDILAANRTICIFTGEPVEETMRMAKSGVMKSLWESLEEHKCRYTREMNQSGPIFKRFLTRDSVAILPLVLVNLFKELYCKYHLINNVKDKKVGYFGSEQSFGANLYAMPMNWLILPQQEARYRVVINRLFEGFLLHALYSDFKLGLDNTEEFIHCMVDFKEDTQLKGIKIINSRTLLKDSFLHCFFYFNCGKFMQKV